VLRPVAHLILRPVYRRMDEIARLAERVDRHLPIVENVIESQNADLRARTRESAEIRAELGRLREDLVEVRRQLDELRALVASGVST